MLKKVTLGAMLLGVALVLSAKTIYVDYNSTQKKGNGTQDSPFLSFAPAIKSANPGDHIVILPSDKIIYDVLRIIKKSGTQDKPITIDAGFNIFSGEIPLGPEWKEESPGLFAWHARLKSNHASRSYLILNGHINRMGRTNKGTPSRKFKKPEELQPGEWTRIQHCKPEKGTRLADYSYYLKLPEGAKTPADCNAAMPSFAHISGIEVLNSSYITIKNAIVTHVLNDGCNIHKRCRGIVFENIATVECGDDGVSSHEDGECLFRNLVVIDCSTGFCHIQSPKCTHEHFWIEQIAGREIDLRDNTTNVLIDVWSDGNSIDGIRITNKSGACLMQNVYLNNHNPRAKIEFNVESECKITAENVFYSNFQATKNLPKNFQQAELDAKFAAKRAEFFAIFGGRLEKILK